MRWETPQQELELLEAELQSALQQGRADPFVTYLYGVILSDRWESPAGEQLLQGRMLLAAEAAPAVGTSQNMPCALLNVQAYPENPECRERRAEARAALVQCLHGYPCNWAAWLALADVSGGAEFERASDPGQACSGFQGHDVVNLG